MNRKGGFVKMLFKKQITWKHAIYTQGDVIVQHFKDDMDLTFNSPKSNSFSVKVLYYLDSSNFKRKNKRVT